MSLAKTILIPRDILSAEEQKYYDTLKDKPVELEKRFKWWSMHDLMEYYHSGLMTKENKSNMFSYKIDLTGPELEINSARNPQLISNLNTAMGNLSKVTGEISKAFVDQQSTSAKSLQDSTLSAAMKRGGKKSKSNKKNTNKRGGAVDIATLFSGDRLKTECLNDLVLDTFNSRDRIFIVDGLLPPLTPGLDKQIAEAAAAAAALPVAAAALPVGAAAAALPVGAAAAAALPVGAAAAITPPPVPVQVGGRRKTRKLIKKRKGRGRKHTFKTPLKHL